MEKKYQKTERRFVLMEAGLIPIIEAQSEQVGCADKRRRRSMSDIMRRVFKGWALRKCPKLRNIDTVDWDEAL